MVISRTLFLDDDSDWGFARALQEEEDLEEWRGRGLCRD